MKISTIIDGYNLMHAIGYAPSGAVGQSSSVNSGVGLTALHKARLVLVSALAEKIPAIDQERTVVVFDSALSKEIKNTSFDMFAIAVKFAIDHETADAMIIEMIRKHSTPKKLTVVSSDHEIQVAAKRRGAVAHDSDQWFFERLEMKPPFAEPEKAICSEEDHLKSNKISLDDEETQAWTSIFNDDEIEDENIDRSGKVKPKSNATDSATSKSSQPIHENSNNPDELLDAFDIPDDDETKNWNPFPDDYLDDLIDGEE